MEVRYHTGHLAKDRYVTPRMTADEQADAAALNALAADLWNRARDGKVTLYQRRQTPHSFAYFWRPIRGAF
jgi:hypothetical protein